MKITVIEPGHELITPREWIAEYPRLTEIAGRTCYKSEEKITGDSAGRFVRMLIKSGHESVLEHLSITVKIIGDRTMSHQLVRHRIAAYSQESQRYCNYGKLGFQVIATPDDNCPPGIYEVAGGDNGEIRDQNGLIFPFGNPYDFLLDVHDACESYLRRIKRGMKPEDARSVLPGCTKTEVVTTFNLRQWRHVLRERALNSHAQWQIRGIMLGILSEFSALLPDFFFDLAVSFATGGA